MLRLWRMAGAWRPGEAQLSTWLYRVAANLCTDRLRRRRPSAGLDAAEAVADAGPGPEAALMTANRADALAQALLALPERQRQAVVLRHLEGFSNPEIAQIMETGVEAVESLLARGKRGLAAVLSGRRAELGYDDDRAMD
jgi:RNA polymerase sigma-70 factor (ECF subfamily)